MHVNRRERLVHELQQMIYELSGVPISDIDPHATFLELGFDSLFLTQANSNIKKRFKVKITVRQLLEKLPRVDALATFLDEQLPPDTFPHKTHTTITANGTDKAASQTKSDTFENTPTFSNPVGNGSLKEIIDRQLEIMAQHPRSICSLTALAINFHLSPAMEFCKAAIAWSSMKWKNRKNK